MITSFFSRKRNATEWAVLILALACFVVSSDAGAQIASPTIFDVAVTDVASRSAIIRWRTQLPADASVEYGPSEAYGFHSGTKSTLTIGHAIPLEGLRPDSIYFFRVWSRDAAGLLQMSDRFTFATLPVSGVRKTDAAAPVLAFSSPQQRSTVTGPDISFFYSIQGKWSSSDKVPHIYLRVDELRNGAWVEGVRSIEIGSRTQSAFAQGSFQQAFAPGVYRIEGFMAVSQPAHSLLSGTVQPLVFIVAGGDSQSALGASSGSLPPPSGPNFKIGSRIRNAKVTDVRQIPASAPSNLGAQQINTKGTIIGGPSNVSGEIWWSINYDIGFDGWSRESALTDVNAPAFDFALKLATSSPFIRAGSSFTQEITAVLNAGAARDVLFSVAEEPAQSLLTLSINSCRLPCKTALRLSTSRATPPGTYRVTLNARSGETKKSAIISLNVSPYAPLPDVEVSAPVPGETIGGTSATLLFRVSTDAKAYGATHVEFSLDDMPAVRAALFETERRFTGLKEGSHVIAGRLIKASGEWIAGTDFIVPFSMNPSAPVLSATTAMGITTTSGLISWSTDGNTAARILYGPTGQPTLTGTASEAVGFQKTHQVELSNLVPCAAYTYVPSSFDTKLKEGHGSATEFVTRGCVGSASVIASNAIWIHGNAGGYAALTHQGRTATLSVPAGIQGDASFQILKLERNPSINAASTPGFSSRLVSGHVYRIVALKDHSRTFFSFTKPISLTFTYEPSDVQGLNSASLRIWRWNGVQWLPTDACAVDAIAYEVTCQTREISTFALFGEPGKIGNAAALPYTASILSTIPSSALSVLLPPDPQSIWRKAGFFALGYFAPGP